MWTRGAQTRNLSVARMENETISRQWLQPKPFSKKNKQILKQRKRSNTKKKRRNPGQESSAMAQETILTINDRDSHTHPIMPKPMPKKRMKTQTKEETLLIVGPQNGKDKVNLPYDSQTTEKAFISIQELHEKIRYLSEQ